MLSDPSALGIVPDEGRGSLPFALIYGESLISVATLGLEEADITVLDPRTEWSYVVDCELAVVLHDPLCPLTPADFLTEAIAAANDGDHVVVGVRPVTDTVKRDHDGRLGETIDRSQLREVTSPIVIPARIVAELSALPEGDFAAIAKDLARFGVRELQAPPLARRVRSVDDIRLLEALGRSDRLEHELLGHR